MTKLPECKWKTAEEASGFSKNDFIDQALAAPAGPYKYPNDRHIEREIIPGSLHRQDRGHPTD